jgi:tetratricopeptide (TPR) repeat protein
VNEPGPVAEIQGNLSPPVFVSYATSDRKQALSVCKAIELRGTRCWISSRDVPPGENYQEAIVRALRSAPAMVLVFSDAANNSDEIKKELSLASRYHVPVMALRIEDVEPSDAFAYELSTRQWIDAFEGWDQSIDALVRRLAELLGARAPASRPALTRKVSSHARKRTLAIPVGIAVMLAFGAIAWWLFRPAPVATHGMQVRLAGFKVLSPDLPATLPQTTADEITAAFSDDGAITVSTASAAPPGPGTAYAFGGTIRRDANKIRVVSQLTDERSGTTIWSNIIDYDSDQLPRVPRRIAVEAGNELRCGLFGASTYPRQLPNPVLADYMQYCANSGLLSHDPGRALNFANRVVAAAPDFSWGWSGVGWSAVHASLKDPKSAAAQQFRHQASDAANKALAIDKTNSEALTLKAYLLDARDFTGREKLFKEAAAARPMACGCEHQGYGALLLNVGRTGDAIAELRRAADVLPLDVYIQEHLATLLTGIGRPDEAKPHIDAAIDLENSPAAADEGAIFLSANDGDYADALKAVHNPRVDLPAPYRAALLQSFQALVSRDPTAMRGASQSLIALPPDLKDDFVPALLGALGANREALQYVSDSYSEHQFTAPALLFLPTMRGALSDPAAIPLLQRFGLLNYWKTTHTKPDVCSAKDPPPFCRII